MSDPFRESAPVPPIMPRSWPAKRHQQLILLRRGQQQLSGEPPWRARPSRTLRAPRVAQRQYVTALARSGADAHKPARLHLAACPPVSLTAPLVRMQSRRPLVAISDWRLAGAHTGTAPRPSSPIGPWRHGRGSGRVRWSCHTATGGLRTRAAGAGWAAPAARGCHRRVGSHDGDTARPTHTTSQLPCTEV